VGYLRFSGHILQMDVRNCEGLEFLETLEDGSVDLVLTDPPYITSRDTGMNVLWDQVHNGEVGLPLYVAQRVLLLVEE